MTKNEHSHPIRSDEILTTRATAELLGVAVSTAQQWVESGTLKSWKTPGGHRRIPRSEVMKLLESRAVGMAHRDRPLPTSTEFLPKTAPTYPVPHDEENRLLAVDALALVDTCAADVFDRITWLAAQVTSTPMALITLLTARRQWFQSKVGIDVTETPREWAFCSHAILDDQTFVVEDAQLDPRFADNPLVQGEPKIRFYAGVPLINIDGYHLGTLCVLDREPRKLRKNEIRALEELAAIASEELRRKVGLE